MLLSGSADRHLNAFVNTAQELVDHILTPLAATCAVGVFVSATDLRSWETHWLPTLRRAPGLTRVKAEQAPPLPWPRMHTRFRDEFSVDWAQERFVQVAQVRQAWELMARFEAVWGTFKWVVKARIDLVYRPDQRFVVAWLSRLPNNTVATPATELHCADRWIDRTASHPTSCFLPPDERAWPLGETWPHQAIRPSAAPTRPYPWLVALCSPNSPSGPPSTDNRCRLPRLVALVRREPVH